MPQPEDMARLKEHLLIPSEPLPDDLVPMLSDPTCLSELSEMLDSRWQQARQAAPAQRMAAGAGDDMAGQLLRDAKTMMLADLGIPE